MTTARDIMTPQAEYLRSTEKVSRAAAVLAEFDIGALPVCDPQGHITGFVTDRDIVVKVVASEKDPRTVELSEIVDQPELVTIGADDPVEAVLAAMKQHQVRRLPVIDGNQMVGIVSQADVARHTAPEQVGDMVAAISD